MLYPFVYWERNGSGGRNADVCGSEQKVFFNTVELFGSWAVQVVRVGQKLIQKKIYYILIIWNPFQVGPFNK